MVVNEQRRPWTKHCRQGLLVAGSKSSTSFNSGDSEEQLLEVEGLRWMLDVGEKTLSAIEIGERSSLGGTKIVSFGGGAEARAGLVVLPSKPKFATVIVVSIVSKIVLWGWS